MTTKEKLQDLLESIESWQGIIELESEEKGMYKKSYVAGYLDATDEMTSEIEMLIDDEETRPLKSGIDYGTKLTNSAKDETATDNFNLTKLKNVVDELECDLIREMDFIADNEEDKAYQRGLEYALTKLKALTT